MQHPQKLSALINDVEELLAELSDKHEPDIKELRARLEHSIEAARRATAGVERGTARLRRYVGSVDNYINDYPRLAFATGLMVAGFVAFFVGATSSRANSRST